MRSTALLMGCLAVVTGLALTARAQAPAGQVRQVLTEAASKAIVDRRVDAAKVALGLTSEQAGLWPPVEQAIRERATARHQRLAKLAALRSGQGGGGGEVNPIELMRGRADALAQRSASLKKLADEGKSFASLAAA